MPTSQTKMVVAVLLLLAALLDGAACSSRTIQVPPIKPGQVNQTIVVNVPDAVEVTRAEQRGDDTSARLVLAPPPGGDCLLSDCDENDVGCDGLQPCGPYCPAEACSRVNCTQCWQAGFGGPCCWSCCSQYVPYTYSHQALAAPQQRQQSSFYTYTQRVATQPQQLRPLQFSQPQLIPIQQLQPIPIPQPQPIPIPQPQPIPVPQPQPIPISQPFPISVPQPYAVPQTFQYLQPQPQLLPQPQVQQLQYYPPPPCRQVPSWPFLQCPPQQPPTCGPWYQPGCIPQPTWSNPCYTVGTC